jgi:uncharacterized protein (DUF4415 family)
MSGKDDRGNTEGTADGNEKEKKSQTDFERLSKMDDSELDLSDVPEMDAEFWESAEARQPGRTKLIGIDEQTVEKFQKIWRTTHQLHINQVLKAYIDWRSKE